MPFEWSNLTGPVAALRGRQAELENRLCAWSAINSGSFNRAGVEAMGAVLQQALSAFPGAVESIPLPETALPDNGVFQPGRALRLRVRPAAPVSVLLNGHYDTVFGPAHPFQTPTRLDDGRINGPGVADMKGGLLILLTALEVFEQMPGATHLGYEVLLTPDEEIGSVTSAALLRESAPRHRLGLVFEPTLPDGRIVRRRKGVGRYTATVHGKASHAGRDLSAGRNAIVALARWMVAVDSLNGRWPGVSVNVGRIAGGGPTNIVPDLATAYLDARASTASEMEAIGEALAELAARATGDGIRVEWNGRFNRPPFDLDPAREAAFALWRECAAQVGLTADWGDSGGGSDANLLAQAGLTCLDGLGVQGGELHSDREYMVPASLTEKSALAALFLNRLAERAGRGALFERLP